MALHTGHRPAEIHGVRLGFHTTCTAAPVKTRWRMRHWSPTYVTALPWFAGDWKVCDRRFW